MKILVEDGEDVPLKLSTLVVAKVEKENLLTEYKSVGDGIVYNEEWDGTAEVKKSEREDGVEEREICTGEVDTSEVEESDYFEARE